MTCCATFPRIGASVPAAWRIRHAAGRDLCAGLLHRRPIPDAQAGHRPARWHAGHADRAHPRRQQPSQDSLQQAQEIIETRVNGLGVSGSEVVIDGDNLVITVPGDDSSQARSLGHTAQLYIRPVLSVAAPQRQGRRRRADGTGPGRARRPRHGGPRRADPGAPRPPTRRPEPPAPASGIATPPAARAARRQRRPPPAGAGRSRRAQQQASGDRRTPRRCGRAPIRGAAAGDGDLDCTTPDPLAGNDDPTLPLVACSHGRRPRCICSARADHRRPGDRRRDVGLQLAAVAPRGQTWSSSPSGSRHLGRVHLSETSASRPRSCSTRRWSARRWCRGHAGRQRAPRSRATSPASSAQGTRQHPEVRLAAAVVPDLRGRDRVGDARPGLAAGGSARRRRSA